MVNNAVDYKTMHLFAGAGGGILADLLLGHTPVGAVEIESYPQEVLKARQADGSLPRFPLWDDVRSFDPTNREAAHFINLLRLFAHEIILAGGFPCRDISAAGKGAGITGVHSSLWFEFIRLVRSLRPRFVFIENSAMLRNRGLGTVLKGLAQLGYDARWCVLGARHLGASHGRDRMWVLAYTDQPYSSLPAFQGDVLSHPDRYRGSLTGQPQDDAGQGGQRGLIPGRSGDHGGWEHLSTLFKDGLGQRLTTDGQEPQTQPDMGRVADGMAVILDQSSTPQEVASAALEHWGIQFRYGVTGHWWSAPEPVVRISKAQEDATKRFKAVGNGQVPIVAAIAWKLLSYGLTGPV